MIKKIYLPIIFICILLSSCKKDNTDDDPELSNYTEEEAIDLNLRCFMIFNQFAEKESNSYEGGAVNVVYTYSSDIINAQYQGKVDLAFSNYQPSYISFGGYSESIEDFTLNGSGYVIGLMDSYNGRYVTTYDGNLSGKEGDKTFQIKFHFEIIQSQTLSNVGYFEVNGKRYDFSADGSNIPGLVK